MFGLLFCAILTSAGDTPRPAEFRGDLLEINHFFEVKPTSPIKNDYCWKLSLSQIILWRIDDRPYRANLPVVVGYMMIRQNQHLAVVYNRDSGEYTCLVDRVIWTAPRFHETDSSTDPERRNRMILPQVERPQSDPKNKIGEGRDAQCYDRRRKYLKAIATAPN